MLFWHNQPKHYHQHSTASYIRNDMQQIMVPNSPFQYVLCAATSPAVKQQDETLTYLNQGQSYEIRMVNRKLVYIVHVVFHDYIPLSVGVVKPRAHSLQHTTVKFLWDPVKNTSVFIQVNCISTELTPRKHGGEKGVPFRIQIDTFTPNKHGEYLEHVHFSSCQVEVFKTKGADSYHSSPTSCSFTESNSSPIQQGELILSGCSSEFPPFCRIIYTFSGADLLKMSREDLIQICGLADGIQLFNAIKGSLFLWNPLCMCIQPRLTIYVCQQQDLFPPMSTLSFYNVTPQQISHIYRQGPTGIHVLVSDEMVQNFTEETSFVISTLKYENNDGYHVVLK
uniref:Grh/CP2 DB domain-containing protein n=1 Tax=Oncorhynchus tshawytscha TaxID=74940 RepID=A0A8C8BXN2_ONCTS